MNLSAAITVVFFVAIGTAWAEVPEFAGFGSINDEAGVGLTLSVVGEDGTAAGGDEAEFRSIEAALARAAEALGAGVGVRIVLAPGIYDEPLELTRATLAANVAPEATAAPLVLESERPGEAVFTRLKRLRAWVESAEDRWRAPWPLSLEQPVEGGVWPHVFYEGVRLREASSWAEAAPWEYWLDRTNRRFQLRVPSGFAFNGGALTVALDEPRPFLLIEGLSSIVLRGLRFERMATARPSGRIPFAAVVLRDVYNLTVENCSFRLNAGYGLFVEAAAAVTVKNTSFRENGGWGVRARMAPGLLLLTPEARFNGWNTAIGELPPDFSKRRSPGGLYLESPGGVVIREPLITDNRGLGLKAACRSGSAQVEGGTIAANTGSGLLLEEAHAFLVRGTTLGGNGAPNLQIGAVAEEVLITSAVLAVAETQKPGAGFVDALLIEQTPARLGIQDCVLTAQPGNHLLALPDGLPRKDLSFGGNLLFRAESEDRAGAEVSEVTASVPDLFLIGKEALTLEEFMEHVRMHSPNRIARPQFVDPSNFNFELHLTSPWFDKDSWGPLPE